MNLDKIKAKLANIEAKNNSKSKTIWKPSPGKQEVRIVPYKGDKDYPFLELYFHYDFGGRTIISPISFGNPDPIQKLSDQLRSTGDKEDWNLSRKIAPKLRIYVPILVRGKEEEGVKYWGFGNQIYEELLKYIDDPDYGDISDLKNGTDIVVEYTAAAGPGSFPKTAIRMRKNTSVVSTDKAVIKLLDEMPLTSEMWPEPTYAELEKLLQAFIENSDAEEEEEPAGEIDDEDDDSPVGVEDDIFPEAKGNGKKLAGKNVKADVDEAFDEMFK